MRHSPQRAQTTQVLEWESGRRRHVLDDLAGEEPLEIRVNGTAVSVTMRTPGDDFELAAGFLLAEGIVQSGDEIQRIAFGRLPDGQPSGNIVDVVLKNDTPLDSEQFGRHFVAGSSCGVCGKASIAAILYAWTGATSGQRGCESGVALRASGSAAAGSSRIREDRRTACGRLIRT